MPNRILKDSICTSDNLDKLTPEQEVFWYRLLVQCDDYGRMDARPAIIRAKCFPLKLATVTEGWVASALRVLADVNLIRLYMVADKPYLQVVTWENHQQIRAKRSKYPPMISSDINGNHPKSDAPVIQSNPNPIQSESYAATVRAAYEADNLMMTKPHLDAHLETIGRVGLVAWQAGWKAAKAEGKQNVVNYVARCAESVMLASGNGHSPPTNEHVITRMPSTDGAEWIYFWADTKAEARRTPRTAEDATW